MCVPLKTKISKFPFSVKKTNHLCSYTYTHTHEIDNGFLDNGGMGNTALLSTYYFKNKTSQGVEGHMTYWNYSGKCPWKGRR